MSTESTPARIANAMVPDHDNKPTHHDAFTMLDDDTVAVSRRQGRTLRIVPVSQIVMPTYNAREGAVNAL